MILLYNVQQYHKQLSDNKQLSDHSVKRIKPVVQTRGVTKYGVGVTIVIQYNCNTIQL